jgi:D-threo-aldose 1-dehydrogenase
MTVEGFTSLERRPIAGTGLTVPILGVGCSPFGNRRRLLTPADVDATVAAALAVRAGYFDTAPYYGFGLSERRLGDALREAPRDSFVLSTKVGRLLAPDPDIDTRETRSGFLSPMPFSPMFDYSYDGVMRSFEASLHRLGLARIDILLVHDIGASAHGADHAVRFREFLDGGFRALTNLRASGLIRAFGLGVNECGVCEEVLDAGGVDCFLLAGRYSLLEQGALDHLLPRCVASGTSVIIGGPYNSGLLAGGTRGGGMLTYDYRPATPEVLGRVRAIEEVCDSYAVPIAAAALQLPLAHPAVAAVVPGIGSAHRMRQTRELLDFPVPRAFWETLRDRRLLDARAPLPGDANQAGPDTVQTQRTDEPDREK